MGAPDTGGSLQYSWLESSLEVMDPKFRGPVRPVGAPRAWGQSSGLPACSLELGMRVGIETVKEGHGQCLGFSGPKKDGPCLQCSHEQEALSILRLTTAHEKKA